MADTTSMDKNKRKRKNDYEEIPTSRKSKMQWKPEDCAKPIGKIVNITGGEGVQRKFHYKTFEFRGSKYELEDSVLLNSGDAQRKNYVAIIKDIYSQAKDRYVMLEVQWFYRLEDVDEKIIVKSKYKQSKDIFYSFHRDVVYAESVKDRCIVHFVPACKQIPERTGFIVQKVYDPISKKLWDFDYKKLNELQKIEVNHLVAKTTNLRYLDDKDSNEMQKTELNHLVPETNLQKLDNKDFNEMQETELDHHAPETNLRNLDGKGFNEMQEAEVNHPVPETNHLQNLDDKDFNVMQEAEVNHPVPKTKNLQTLEGKDFNKMQEVEVNHHVSKTKNLHNLDDKEFNRMQGAEVNHDVPKTKNLQNLDDDSVFNEMKETEVNHPVPETHFQTGELPNIVKERPISKSRRKKSVPKRFVKKNQD